MSGNNGKQPLLGVGIVGAGVIGQLRARAIARVPTLRLKAVADLDRQRADRLAGAAGATSFPDHRALIDAPGIDAVIVSTPVHVHREVATAALQGGKHVLCEKPLSNDVASCRALVGQARSARRGLATGFNHRYFPCVRFLKQTIDAGTIGALDHLRVFGGHEGLAQLREEWMYNSPVSGGGAAMDIGIHMIDLVRWLAGEIAEVYGITTNRIWDLGASEDNALAMLKSTTGVPITYQATWSEWKGYRFAIEAYGSRGMASARYAPMFNLLIRQQAPGASRRRSVRWYAHLNLREKLWGWEANAIDALAMELGDFARMAAGGDRGSIADGVAGMRAVEIANAIYESNQRAMPVRLGRQPPGGSCESE